MRNYLRSSAATSSRWDQQASRPCAISAEPVLAIELATAIHDYIELWHNPRRRHSALGMRTPDEIETAWLQANAATTTTGAARTDRATIPNGDDSEPSVTITNDTNHTA